MVSMAKVLAMRIMVTSSGGLAGVILMVAWMVSFCVSKYMGILQRQVTVLVSELG